MKLLTFLVSPLEQFEILPLLSLNFGNFDFSITNQTIILFLVCFFIITLFFAGLKPSTNSLFIVPNRWQSLIEGMYMLVLAMVIDNIGGKKNQFFFPFSIHNFLLYY
jgi:F0F1-type ATP synthase membrane subunit a